MPSEQLTAEEREARRREQMREARRRERLQRKKERALIGLAATRAAMISARG